MKLEKFNITNKIKRELARKVKNEIVEQVESNAKSIYYGEFGIMYNESREFYIAATTNIEEEQFKGNCLYRIISFDQENIIKTTLKEIEEKIFG